MIIVLDKGHGEKDPGAVGNGLQEAMLTDQIGNSVAKYLSGYNVTVLFAPRGSLSSRASFANQNKADFFLSIHVNSGGGTGYESYTHLNAPQGALKIAEGIHTHIASMYAQRGFKDRGLKRANFQVLRETKMPSMLIENLFIDNKNDAEFLKGNTDGIGKQIADALVKAFDLKRRDAVVERPEHRTIDQWELDVMKWAEDAKLITSGIHHPYETADKSFVLAVIKNLKGTK